MSLGMRLKYSRFSSLRLVYEALVCAWFFNFLTNRFFIRGTAVVKFFYEGLDRGLIETWAGAQRIFLFSASLKRFYFLTGTAATLIVYFFFGFNSFCYISSYGFFLKKLQACIGGV